MHYQLHSVALKALLHCPSPPSSPTREEGVAGGQRVESAIAEALVELKDLPLCKRSYPALWAWTKQLCSKAFSEDDTESQESQQVGDTSLDKRPSETSLESQKESKNSLTTPPEAQNTGAPQDAPLEAQNTGTPQDATLEVCGQKKSRDLVDIAAEHGVTTESEENMVVDVVGVSSPALATPLRDDHVVGSSSPPPATPPPGAKSQTRASVEQRGGVAPPVTSPQLSSYLSLLQLCIYGVAVCAVRYPAFFKPLYRLAATLHTIGLSRVS